jgi:hypothetical protein
MHGGANGSGAPLKNKNAYKHGYFTREAISERKRTRNLLQRSRELVSEIGKRAVRMH